MSILSNICKVYERYIQEQLNCYLVNLPLEFQRGFRQSFSAQQSLLVLIEKLRKLEIREVCPQL